MMDLNILRISLRNQQHQYWKKSYCVVYKTRSYCMKKSKQSNLMLKLLYCVGFQQVEQIKYQEHMCSSATARISGSPVKTSDSVLFTWARCVVVLISMYLYIVRESTFWLTHILYLISVLMTVTPENAYFMLMNTRDW